MTNDIDDIKTYELHAVKSPLDERDYVAETILHDDISNLPEEYDMRKDLLPIRNQGHQGSCVGMASAAMKEWQEEFDVHFKGYMSPQFIYNNRANKTTAGMNLRDAMKILSKIGSVPEHAYPYETTRAFSSQLLERAAKYRIKSYAQVKSILGLKKSLVKNGPCLLVVPVYNYGARMWAAKQGDPLIGGHCMCLVGYNKSGFIVRNSWGSNWNDEGYTVFPYEDFGMQWEIWTTIDEESGKPIVVKKKSLWEKLKLFFKNLF